MGVEDMMGGSGQVSGGFGWGSSSMDKSGTQTTELDFDEATKAYLDKILGGTEYSKEAAIKDSSMAAEWALKKSLEAGVPAVSSAARSAGGYSSTTEEMLRNDASARAQAAGSQVMLDTISKYAAAQAGQVQAATGAVAATTGRKVTMDETAHGGSRNTGLSGIAKTVICTQLYLDKHIPLNVYAADCKYVHKHFSAATQRGYRFWAVPLVRLMRRKPAVYRIVKYFGVKWSLHCASHYNFRYSPNWVGRILIAVAAPICYCIGHVVQEVPYIRAMQGE